MIILRETSSPVVQEFGIDTIGLVCLSEEILHTRTDEFVGILGRMNNCSDFGNDPQSQIIDFYNETIIYTENGLSSAIIVNPGYAQSIANTSLYLNSLSRYQLRNNSICLEANLFEFSKEYIIEYENRNLYQAIFILTSFIFGLFSCSCCTCVLLKSRATETLEYNVYWNNCYNIIQLMQISATWTIFMLGTVNMNEFEIQNKHYSVVIANSCFMDDELNNIISRFRTDYSPQYREFWMAGISIIVVGTIGGLVSLSELVGVIVHSCKKCQQKKIKYNV